MREKKKKVERENVEFRQQGYRIFCAQFCCLGVRGVPEMKREKKKKNWQTNCGNAIAEIGKKNFVTIVVMALPKMGEKNVVPKSGESKKKKGVTLTIFSQ